MQSLSIVTLQYLSQLKENNLDFSFSDTWPPDFPPLDELKEKKRE